LNFLNITTAVTNEITNTIAAKIRKDGIEGVEKGIQLS
jgi:hypothetical protein